MSRKMDVYKRMLQVKKLYLKGYSVEDISENLAVSKDVIKEDLKRISAMYLKSIENNPHILSRQVDAILQHLEQLQMVKKELWELSQKTEITDKEKINALKTILTELEHESKVLRLVDTSKIVIQNYIHVDKINVLMSEIANIINEFVPEEKRKYAFSRLQGLGKVIDVEGKVEEETNG